MLPIIECSTNLECFSATETTRMTTQAKMHLFKQRRPLSIADVTFEFGNMIRYSLMWHRDTRPFSRTTRVSQYQKGKANPAFTEARDSEWQRHQLGHMQVCTSLQTDNHASTPPLHSVFLQAGCPSCRPTNSVKALKGAQRERQNQ